MYARVWENRYCITCIICITRISRTPHTYTGIASRLRPYRATPIYVWANVNIRMKRCRYTHAKANVEDPRSRTAQIAKDQFHLQGGENPLPVLVACLIQLMAELPVMSDPSRQAVESGTRTDIGSIGHGQLPFAIRAHRPLIQIFVVCLHKIGVFQFIYRNKDTEKVRIRQRSDPLIFIFYHLIYPDFTPPLRDSFRRKPEVVHS